MTLQTIEWQDFLTDTAVRAAYSDLERLATRDIRLHPLSLVPKLENAFWYATDKVHHIFIDERKDQRHSVVHELLHAILMEEGYSFVRGRFHDRIHPILTNDHVHPEVFRRMGDYGVDMDAHWKHWRAELSRVADYYACETFNGHAPYAQFACVFPWHSLGKDAEPFVMAIAANNPALGSAVAAAAQEASLYGSTTAEFHRRTLETFKMHWLRFSEQHLSPGDTTSIPDAIRDSRIVPIAEFRNEIAEDRIYDNLAVYGLKRDA